MVLRSVWMHRRKNKNSGRSLDRNLLYVERELLKLELSESMLAADLKRMIPGDRGMGKPVRLQRNYDDFEYTKAST